MTPSGRTAILIGASSGIGEALARQLHAAGWRLGLLARRLDRLEQIATELGSNVSVRYIDVASCDCVDSLKVMIRDLERVDLILISAGFGYLNLMHVDDSQDLETVSVNILGFVAMAQTAFRYFESQGHGHLAAITSIAALRGNREAITYAASKAFQSVYLDGLREAAGLSKSPITITELQPGFVDTAMMKTMTPLSPLLRKLLVSDASTAARQMLQAIARKRKHAYITRRYAAIALLLKLLPRPGK